MEPDDEYEFVAVDVTVVDIVMLTDDEKLDETVEVMVEDGLVT